MHIHQRTPVAAARARPVAPVASTRTTSTAVPTAKLMAAVATESWMRSFRVPLTLAWVAMRAPASTARADAVTDLHGPILPCLGHRACLI